MQGYTVISQLSELAAFGKFTILVENCERKDNLRVGKDAFSSQPQDTHLGSLFFWDKAKYKFHLKITQLKKALNDSE